MLAVRLVGFGVVDTPDSATGSRREAKQERCSARLLHIVRIGLGVLSGTDLIVPDLHVSP